MSVKDYYELYDELVEICKELYTYYDIDKIKPYSVYIWDKEPDNAPDDYYGENLFDILSDKIQFYSGNNASCIIEESKPIIAKIQLKLSEMK